MTDLLEQLRAADPARDERPDPVAARRMDAELHRLVGSTPRRRPPLRWATALAVAAVAAAGTLAGLPGEDDGGLVPADASAATVLTQLGERAAAGRTGDGSGRYAYSRTIAYITHYHPDRDGVGTHVVVLPHVSERWLDADGDGVIVNRTDLSRPYFPTQEDREAITGPLREPPGDERPKRVENLRTAGLTSADIAALPTDPTALRAAIEAAAGRARLPLTGAVAQLLSDARTSPEVRAALFGVLRELSGATVEPKVTDPQGRTGIGVRFEAGAWDTLFVFDRSTGELLGTRSIGKRELPGRETTDWTLVLELGHRDTAPAVEDLP